MISCLPMEDNKIPQSTGNKVLNVQNFSLLLLILIEQKGSEEKIEK